MRMEPSGDAVTRQIVSGPDRRVYEVWVWLVMKDSILSRRPPIPKVEEIQIREVDPSVPSHLWPDLKPSWEQE